MFISIFLDVTCEARSPGRRHAGPIELVVWAVAVAVAGEAVPRPRPRHPDRVFWNISADCGARCSHCVAILCCKRLAPEPAAAAAASCSVKKEARRCAGLSTWAGQARLCGATIQYLHNNTTDWTLLDNIYLPCSTNAGIFEIYFVIFFI